MNRRVFFASAAAPLLGAQKQEERYFADWEKPVFNLRGVQVAGEDRLHRAAARGRHYFVRTRSTDGADGIIETKQIEDYIPILLRRVIPAYLGKDARDLETLVDDVYMANYKMAGQPFWCPVAYVEQSLFDLLGKAGGQAGGRADGRRGAQGDPGVPVRFRARDHGGRGGGRLRRGVEYTGAKAVKFKIGGRMSRNRDAYPGRTETMMELARKRLGDKIIALRRRQRILQRGQGASRSGRMLEELKYAIFEEPCPWEELSETKKVADALTIPVAAGEQDSSLWRFQWMIDNRVIDIVQPDLNYNGGFVRAARVARMARQAGMLMVPHNTQTGAASVNILQFASATPNIGPYMEYPWRAPEKANSRVSPNPRIENGKVKVPTGPGFGLQFDPDFLKKAVKVETC